jgi:hypothetical protein
MGIDAEGAVSTMGGVRRSSPRRGRRGDCSIAYTATILTPDEGDLFSFTRRILSGLQWREVTDFASPALFDVVSSKALATTATALLRAQGDVAGSRRANAERGRLLTACGLPVLLAESVDGQLPTTLEGRVTRGELLLRLYFHQLLVGTEALLDLGPSRFSGVNPVIWSPSWARYSWSDPFRLAVRDLYAGFYGADDARFDEALATLGLTPARAVFVAHFGGEQTAVRFSVAHFRQTFHAAFVACRDAGTQIHPDFVPMGLMLASLYAHLEPLDVRLDVRAAWRDSASVVARVP